jgi:hypothetical protein
MYIKCVGTLNRRTGCKCGICKYIRRLIIKNIPSGMT